MDALAHLSHMPTLTQLDCRLSATLPPSHSPLVFPNLHHLRLFSGFLDPISWLLSRTQLPAIAHLTTLIGGHPSKQAFSSFLSSIQTSGLGTIQELVLLLDYEDVEDAEDATPVLGLEDLQPYMTFSNLRYLDININWNMDLTDSGVLALALAWPHLECLSINAGWGWNTPKGLLQLLQTCLSLTWIALSIDTRGYTEFRELPASLGLTLPPTLSIHVVDSQNLYQPSQLSSLGSRLGPILCLPAFVCGLGRKGSHGPLA